MSEKEKLITAYHEGGHALVAAALPGTDPVHKVTILPRGRALGYTMVLPDEDKYSQTRSEMLDNLAYMLGGMAAEALIFHDVTSGAGNDIEKATNLARAMVTQYGMSERLGAVKLGDSNSEPFLGRDMGHRATTPRRSPRSSTRRSRSCSATPTRRPSTSSRRTATSSTRWCSQLLDKETLDKAEIAEIFDAAPAAPGPSGVDRAPTRVSPARSRRSRSRRRSATALHAGALAQKERGRRDPHAARRRR